MIFILRYFFKAMLVRESTRATSEVGMQSSNSQIPVLGDHKVHEIDSNNHRVSMGLSILNLVKNIIGTSMLSMSFGVACSGVVPSVVICLLFGALSAFTFGLIGILCGEAKVTSFRGVCEKYIHPKCGVYIDVLLALYTLPACIAYSIFVCDCMRKMIVALAPQASDAFYASRWFIAIVLTVAVLLPLCCITRLDRLTFTSILGIAAILYCYIFVAVDLSKNDNNASSNIAHALWWPPSGSILGLFPMANIYAACYLVQYNSPKFYFELRNPTRTRFFALAFSTNAIVALICGSFAIMGFARFGVTTPDNLLIAYDHAYVVWVATCVSLVTTYPFVFDAGRRSVMSALAGFPSLNERKVFWWCTFALVPIFSLIAVFVDSLGLVIGINGSLMGITVGFTLPGFLLAQRAKMLKKRKQVFAGYALVVAGILMSTLGLVSIFIDVKPV